MTAYLSLGSNLGRRVSNLRRALHLLRKVPGIHVEKISSLFETSPVGLNSGSTFLNCAARIHAPLSPIGLLTELKRIEGLLGRRPARRKQSRNVDLDIVSYQGLAVRSRFLHLPHPEACRRKFVLTPLAQIAPGLVLSGKTGARTVGQHLARLKLPYQSVRILRRPWTK